MKRQFAAGLAVVAVAALPLFIRSVMTAQVQDKTVTSLKAAMDKETLEGDLKGAIERYKILVQDKDRSIAGRALVRMADSYGKLGQRAEAQTAYERVIREFASQAESVSIARTRLAAMQSPAVAQVGQTVRLLWSDLGRSLGVNAVGPPSADGRYLSFTGGPTGLAILDLKVGRTLSPASLGDDGGYVETSVVSPDGRQVAYDWNLYKEGTAEELRVVQVSDGNAARSRSVHFNHPGEVDVAGWSPDGKSVVVYVYFGEEATQIAVISVADGAVRVLRDFKGQAEKPGGVSFSPDGRYIAYHKPDGVNGRDIFALTLDGKETRVVEGAGDDLDPRWSPDGLHIVFRSNRTGTMSIWMVPVAGGAPSGSARLVKENVGSFYPLGFTRSGTLYYIAGSPTTNVYTAELDAKLNAAAAPSMATDRYVNSTRGGIWSPDGQFFAYHASFPRGVVIRIRSVKTGEDREVPTLIQASGPVRWFPDGQSLLVASRDVRRLNGQLGYYRVNIASGDAELLHQTASEDVMSTRPDLSSDGKTIFYLETPRQPVRLDIGSHRETRLTPVGNPAQSAKALPLSLAVSPDGTQVAYIGAASLVVVPAAGGEPREVVRFSENSNFRERADGLGLAWSPDQRYLFFVRPGRQFRAIWRVPLTGGEAENIGISLNRIRALRMHPDGRRIAFDSVIDAPSELWVLENFLPKAGEAP